MYSSMVYFLTEFEFRLLSPPSEWTEWQRYYFHSMCLCVCVCAQRTVQSDQFKMFKATDFRFDMHVFPGTVQTCHHDPLTIARKGGVARVTWPTNFWALNAISSSSLGGDMRSRAPSSSVKVSLLQLIKTTADTCYSWALLRLAELFTWDD